MKELNNTIKMQRLRDYLKKKQYSTIWCLQEMEFRFKNTNKWKVKGCKMLYHSNSNHNIAGVSILITNKIDLK